MTRSGFIALLDTSTDNAMSYSLRNDEHLWGPRWWNEDSTSSTPMADQIKDLNGPSDSLMSTVWGFFALSTIDLTFTSGVLLPDNADPYVNNICEPKLHITYDAVTFNPLVD